MKLILLLVKYVDGMKSGVKSANQRRKVTPTYQSAERTLTTLPQERIRNKKNKDAQQRATAPATLAGAGGGGILSAASSPETRGAMTPSYQSSKRAMTPTYAGVGSGKTPGYGERTPGYSSKTPGYSSRTPGYSGKSAKTPGY